MTTAAEILDLLNTGKNGRRFERSPQQKLDLLEAVWASMLEGFTFRGACGLHKLPPGSVQGWVNNLPGQIADMQSERETAEWEEIRLRLSNAIKSAHDQAHAAREAWWQTRLMTAASSPALTSAIFALKCSAGGPTEWREAAPEQREDDDGEVTTRVIINFADDNEDQLEMEHAGQP